MTDPMWLCDGGCGYVGRLFLRVAKDDRILCSRCWEREGYPPLKGAVKEKKLAG